MKKNLFILLFAGIFSFLQFGCKKWFEKPKKKGCTLSTSFNYDPTAEEDDGSCREMFGCTGYATGYSNSGYLTNTLGDQFWDQKMIGEIGIQSNFFNGIPASVYVLVEPSPAQKNAYADPSQGRILFGYYMFYYTINTYGELPIAGILAHEWGHRVQQVYGWKNYTRGMQAELEADAFSGFYMALCKQFAWNSIQSYYQNVYATGDYNFNHPSHHGTGDQRLASAYYGVTVALDAIQNGKQYTYQELHTLFINEINAHIGQKTTKGNYPEVEYPTNRSHSYYESLYPRRD